MLHVERLDGTKTTSGYENQTNECKQIYLKLEPIVSDLMNDAEFKKNVFVLSLHFFQTEDPRYYELQIKDGSTTMLSRFIFHSDISSLDQENSYLTHVTTNSGLDLEKLRRDLLTAVQNLIDRRVN